MADALVVGGGPVGFVTALGLARAGLEVELIEAERDIGDSPRAAVYHWSVLDGLERLGLLDDGREAGLIKQDYCYLVRSTGERIRYDLSVLEGRTRHPYNIHLGQHRLAEIAAKHLAAYPNARVRFGTRLERIEQDDTGVTAYVEGADEPIRARWLVGADGGGSTVRKAVGLSFDGITWPERFIATNVWFDFEAAGYPLTTMVIDDRFGAVIVKLDDTGLWRCTFMEDASLPEANYANRIPAAYRELLPYDGPYRIDRAAPYRMHQRAAPSFRARRVVLAGDAAHVTNPTGGLGLTSGLFDAFALYPSLAAVAKGEADESLLDDYARSRRDVFVERTSPQAVRNKDLIFHANRTPDALEAALGGLRLMASDPAVRLERLMFTKSLETRSPAEKEPA
ncbi:FAD-dependent oxidoreductase [Sphingomonas sp. MMS24-J13]|uniref:FAD-dependent oxidoreductase n=1 Tax=Sphingomonas sp. MMS24-J13 TaxID=3238686 RepID=UPI003850C677